MYVMYTQTLHREAKATLHGCVDTIAKATSFIVNGNARVRACHVYTQCGVHV